MSEREAPPRGPGEFAPGLGRPVHDVRALYQRLRLAGLSADEAGNLTAHITGLRVCRQGWTLQQIEHLQFLRSMVDSSRLDP